MKLPYFGQARYRGSFTSVLSDVEPENLQSHMSEEAPMARVSVVGATLVIIMSVGGQLTF